MLRALLSKPYSQLFIVGDKANWVIDAETNKVIEEAANKLGIPTSVINKMPFNIPQVVHYGSQFALLNDTIYKSNNRISIDYFHGKPEQGESFKKCFEALTQHHREMAKVRVSNSSMETLVKSSGIEPSKVMRIPIGVDTEVFTLQTKDNKFKSRERFGLPQEAVVIGSFQKDGVGWGDGNEPKLIKGPDIFLEVVSRLHKEVPNLWVLLSGPSRGFVKKGLASMGIPYVHEYPKDPRAIASFYDAIDLYIIASREEGGPKACLDSMAKGVPLVTTRVGQCADLVENGKNAMMADIEDTEALSGLALQVLRDRDLRDQLIKSGLATAKANNHESQIPLWQHYFKGLINS